METKQCEKYGKELMSDIALWKIELAKINHAPIKPDIETKKCSKCGEVKNVSEYYNDRSRKDGKYVWCKQCLKDGRGIAFSANKAKYYLANKDKITIRNKVNRKSGKEKEYYSRRYRTNITFKISKLIRVSIMKSVKQNKIQKRNGAFNLLNYTKGELVGRLCKTLEKLNNKSVIKYTWQHFLNGELHIDHILPIAKFNYKSTDDEDFKLCWSLENLQLLPAKENLEKGDSCDNFEEKYQELKKLVG